MIAELVFWGAIAMAAWTYVLFPACLWLRARLRPAPTFRRGAAPITWTWGSTSSTA